jgi:hypothetical protein
MNQASQLSSLPFVLSVSEFRTERSGGLNLFTPWYRCEIETTTDTSACPLTRLSIVRQPNWARFLCEHRMAVWLQRGSAEAVANAWEKLFDDQFDEGMLEICRDRLGRINLLSLLTMTRYVRTRSSRMLAANMKLLSLCKEFLRPDNDRSTAFAQLLLTQNLYVTEHCQRALMKCQNPSAKLKDFMAAELGHDLILKRGLEKCNSSAPARPLPAVKDLMRILGEAATQGEQTLAFMIDVFESASIQHEQHPLIKLISALPDGSHMAAALRQHARINGQNHHDLVSFSLLQDAPTASDTVARNILAFERNIHHARIDLLQQVTAQETA